jgi:hypothetical protein
MKTKYLLFAGLLAIFSAATAGAQTYIYISGAPAARTPFSTAIYNVLLANVTGTGGTITYAYSGTSKTTAAGPLTNANAIEFYGGHITVGGNIVPVTVSVSYVGSSAGIQAVAAQTAVQFLPNGVSTGGSPYPEPNGNSSPAQYYSTVPQFTASDEFQKSTPWYQSDNLTGSYVNYQVLHSDVVGVLPYRFVTNADAPASITNITPNQARILFETGYIYLSFLTGQNADENGVVYAIGRDIGSGLRTVFLSESGIGVQTGVQQYEPAITTSTGSYVSGTTTLSGTYTYITSQQLYPAETVNGVSLGSGDGGYSSFSGLQAALASYTNSNGGSLLTVGGTAGWYVTPLAYSDSVTAEKAGSHEVAWNGVYLTGSAGGTLPAGGGASTNLAEGYYTFWSYLQLQYLASTWSSNHVAAEFEAIVGNDLITADATVLLQNLNVGRNAPDGSNILSYNPYASPYSISLPYP